jgi:hypothetical protein
MPLSPGYLLKNCNGRLDYWTMADSFGNDIASDWIKSRDRRSKDGKSFLDVKESWGDGAW